MRFPTCDTVLIHFGFHLSRVTDLTVVMCTPRALCAPLQSMQKSTPKLTDAHRGALEPHSQQTLFSGRATTSSSSGFTLFFGGMIAPNLTMAKRVQVKLLRDYVTRPVFGRESRESSLEPKWL